MSESARSRTLEGTLRGDHADDPIAAPQAGRAIGTRIDRYVITGQLGEGAMGVVYRAIDPQLDRKVALKLLRPGRGRRKRRTARLREEAQALARLSGANVVEVFDVGAIDDEIFIAMEYVHGQTLDAWLQTGPRTPAQIVEVAIGAARGLASAHAAGLVHGDFKPANVMIDEEGVARVLDFGLARPIETESQTPVARGEPLPLSRIAGTPAYMSPEQVIGDPVSPASDQFTFCVTFWEALFGQRPFVGTTAIELATTLVAGGPPALPARHGVPDWLIEVLRRGLSRQPAQRFASMTQLAAELARDRQRRWRGRLVVLGLTAGFVAWAWALAQPVDEARCRQQAVQATSIWSAPRRTQLRDAILAADVSYAEAAVTSVGRAVDRYVDEWRAAYVTLCTTPRDDLTPEVRWASEHCLHERRDQLDAVLAALVHHDADPVRRGLAAIEALPRIDGCTDLGQLAASASRPADASTDPRVEALLGELARADAAGAVGRSQRALALAQRVVDEAEALDQPPLTARALESLGKHLVDAGRVDDASDTLRRAYTIAVAAEAPQVAAAAALRSAVLQAEQAADPAAAREWLFHAQAQLGRPGASLELRAWFHRVSADVAGAERDFDEAVRQLELAQTLYEQLYPDQPQRRAIEAFALAQALRRRGQVERALALETEALPHLQARYGEYHPAMFRAYNHYANALMSTGRLEQAEEYIERSRRVAELAMPEGHPEMAYTLTTLAIVYLDLDDLPRALSWTDEALTLRRKSLPVDHPHLAYTLVDRASILRRLGRHDDAERDLDEALAVAQARPEPDPRCLADTWLATAELRVDQERAEDALTALEAAAPLRRRDGGESNVEIDARTGMVRARALWLLQRPDEATTAAREVLAIVDGKTLDATIGRDLEVFRGWLALEPPAP